MGELGHPDGPQLNLERVSHLIKELRVDGNDIYGKAKILDTPYGKIVKDLIKEGVKITSSQCFAVNWPFSNIYPAGVCIQEFAAIIQKADKVTPIKTSVVDK